jgi:hypothetical protein
MTIRSCFSSLSRDIRGGDGDRLYSFDGVGSSSNDQPMASRFKKICLLLLVFAFQTAEALENCKQWQPNWSACTVSEDCVVVIDPCGWPVSVSNKKYSVKAADCNRIEGAAMSCVAWNDRKEPPRRAECESGTCRNLVAAVTCSDAKAKMEAWFRTLSKKCAKDSECDGYYIRGDSCARPVVLRKPEDMAKFETSLAVEQSKVRMACKTEWQKHPACSPTPFRAVCKNSTCQDGLL